MGGRSTGSRPARRKRDSAASISIGSLPDTPLDVSVVTAAGDDSMVGDNAEGMRSFDTPKPEPDGGHFAGNNFKCMILKENLCILIQISLQFVPKGVVNNGSALVQVMAWYFTGNKPLPEPMLTEMSDATWSRKATTI